MLAPQTGTTGPMGVAFHDPLRSGGLDLASADVAKHPPEGPEGARDARSQLGYRRGGGDVEPRSAAKTVPRTLAHSIVRGCTDDPFMAGSALGQVMEGEWQGR
jgi:hypothetical protein